MYTAAPPPRSPARSSAGPVARPGPARATVGLARVEHQIFGPGGPFGWDDHVYFPDLMRSYGVPCRGDFAAGRRNSFTDMTSAMLPRLGRFADRFDLAVLTGVTPDSQPGFPMCHLGELVAQPGLAFAVFDQGVIAPFTALHTLLTGLRLDGASRGLFIVLDQSTLLHDLPIAERLRVDHDSAVVLVLDPAGALGTIGRPWSCGVDPAGVGRRLAELLRAQSSRAEPASAESASAESFRAAPFRGAFDVLVCGAGLAECLPDRVPVARVLACAPGLPATGVWATLAARLPDWRGEGARVMLADYDEDQRRLSGCVIEVPARPATGSDEP